MKSESFISVVLNTHHLSEELISKIRQIQGLLDENYSDYEILVVSKGPYRDVPRNSAVDLILKTIPSVRFLQLS
ncbi:MAG: hypothetical protein E6388_10375, partial [Streptococcus salivarius]|nr:hypothetical protein [Streptococcus salivarius]